MRVALTVRQDQVEDIFGYKETCDSIIHCPVTKKVMQLWCLITFLWFICHDKTAFVALHRNPRCDIFVGIPWITDRVYEINIDSVLRNERKHYLGYVEWKSGGKNIPMGKKSSSRQRTGETDRLKEQKEKNQHTFKTNVSQSPEKRKTLTRRLSQAAQARVVCVSSATKTGAGRSWRRSCLGWRSPGITWESMLVFVCNRSGLGIVLIFEVRLF